MIEIIFVSMFMRAHVYDSTLRFAGANSSPYFSTLRINLPPIFA